MTTRTRKTKTGSKFVLLVAAIALSSGFTLLAKKQKQAEPPAAYALLAGTVYRPPGFALPGVTVLVTPLEPEVNGAKLKKSQVVTDARGEWTVRVPPVPAKWRVDVKVNGYRPEQRTVAVEGEQRVDVSVVLEPSAASKEANP